MIVEVRRRRSFFSELNKVLTRELAELDVDSTTTDKSIPESGLHKVCVLDSRELKKMIHAVNCSHNDSVCCNQRNVENLDVTALI
ncbi:hypothetical protein P8452_37328 [Trifolium repens]|nr:hypothetical protein P8452_37328 [Trifolium repens]